MGQSCSWEAASSSAKHKSATGPYTVQPSAATFVGNVMNTGGKNGAYLLIGFKTVRENYNTVKSNIAAYANELHVTVFFKTTNIISDVTADVRCTNCLNIQDVWRLTRGLLIYMQQQIGSSLLY